MAKKVKPQNLLDATSNTEAAQDANEFNDKSLVGNGQMTAENKEKLEKYDALQKTVADLLKEKEMLEAKVTEYAERLAELQSAADKINSLNEENKRLQKELDDAKSSSKESSKCILENKALRDEADGYLIKISELTFENANLTCQLDEIKKKLAMNGSGMNQSKFSPNGRINDAGNLRNPNKDAYNPYASNGYSSWN